MLQKRKLFSILFTLFLALIGLGITFGVFYYSAWAATEPLTSVAIDGPISGTTTLTYTFTALPTPAISTTLPITYMWSPEPIAGQGTDTAAYVWTMEGIKTIQVLAINSLSSVSDTHSIDIDTAASVGVSGVSISGPVVGETGTSYGFSASVSPVSATMPITYQWMPEPDSGQGTDSAQYMWSSAGTRVISVTAWNAGGNAVATHNIDISEAVVGVSGVSISGPVVGETGTSYGFSASVSPISATTPITYEWDPTPDSGYGTANVQYTWSTTGTQTISLLVFNETGLATTTHSIDISTPSAPAVAVNDVSISGPVVGETGTSYGFSASVSPISATPPITYQWTPLPMSGQGMGVDLTNVDYEWYIPGVYTIAVQAENCCSVANNTHIITISEGITSSIDLQLDKWANPDPVTVGELLTYTIEVYNQGSLEATGVVLTDVLPANVAFAWADAACVYDSGIHVVTCDLGTVAPQSSTVWLNIVVTPTTEGGIENIAEVWSDETDVNPDDNTTWHGMEVLISEPDLWLDKWIDQDIVAEGAPLTYRLEVYNGGVTEATGVVLTDTLPAGVDFARVTASQGLCTETGGVVACSLGTLWPYSGTATVTLVVTPTQTGWLSNTASVGTSETESDMSNNAASVAVDVIAQSPNLNVNKWATPDPVGAGETLTYHLSVHNYGAVTASGVVVTDTLPAGVIYSSARVDTGTCILSGGAVICDLGTLMPYSGTMIHIAVTTSLTQTGQIHNTAMVGGNEVDLDPNDNAASVSVLVMPMGPDLYVEKWSDQNPVEKDSLLTYHVEVYNYGTTMATNVILSDTLPAGAMFASADGCTLSGNVVRCDLGDLPADGNPVNVTIEITPTVVTGWLSNTVMVGASEADLDDANNMAWVETYVMATNGGVSGKATDRDFGTGVSGIEVCAYPVDWMLWGGCATTLGDGTYRINNLAPGEYRVRFYDPSGKYTREYYNDQPSWSVADRVTVNEGQVTSNIDAALTSSAHITGTVTNANGDPLPNIAVEVQKHNAIEGWWEWVGWDETDASGDYDVGGLRGGDYRVVFYDWWGTYMHEYYNNAFDPSGAMSLTVAAGTTRSNINAVLGTGGHITGVVTSGGTPLRSIAVEVQRYTDGRWQWAGWDWTDAQGRYDIGRLRDGTYRVAFHDWSDQYFPEYYNDKLNASNATHVNVTTGGTAANVNADLTEGGHIAGTVIAPDGSRLPGISIEVYRYENGHWNSVGWGQTNGRGSYDVGGLATGAYRVYFSASDDYAYEYYNNASDVLSATNVNVTAGQTTAGINVQLDDHAPPAAEVGGGGNVGVDSQTGQVTIGVVSWQRNSVAITKVVTCTVGTPTNVELVMDTKRYSMTALGDGRYTATIPETDVQNGDLKVSKACDGIPAEETVGRIELYDPSGYVTDAATGDPIPGATVTLYRVPGWRARIGAGDVTTNTCQSNLSKDPDEPWNQKAPTDLGIKADPKSGRIDPTANPLITDHEGYYGWDVAAGCWYIVVEKEGYEDLTSPVVGVPPEVTDLDVALSSLLQQLRVSQNVSPTLGAIGDKVVDEDVQLAFTATATDTGTITFTLDAGSVGSITSGGAYTWTPTEAQGPGTYTATVRVTDEGGLEDFETINITVNEVDTAPTLGTIGNQAVDEGVQLAFTAIATDTDIPSTITFTLDAGSVGSITPDGEYTWTPTEADGPGTYTATVRVADNTGSEDSETIDITVNEVNVAPTLDIIGNQAVQVNTELAFTVTADDVDIPANDLTFSLDAGSVGSITPDGNFTWTPTTLDTYTATVRVTDSGTPAMDDFEMITITVTSEPVYALSIAYVGNGTGTVTREPNQQQFVAGTVVTLTAQADPGSTFAGWQGAGLSGSSIVVTLTMPAAATSVTATFTAPTLNAVKAVDTGGVTPVPLGEVVTYTVVVSNSGDGTALRTVITDNLSSAVSSFGNVTGTAFLPWPEEKQITWGPMDIPGHSVYTFVFTATVVDTAYAGTTIPNSVAYAAANHALGTSNVVTYNIAAVDVDQAGVQLAPDHSETAQPGDTLTFVHTLTNTGTTTDTFDLTLSAGWGTLLTSTPITLLRDMTATVQVAATVPTDAISGTVHTTTITATSQLAPTVFDAVTDTIIVSRVGYAIYLPLTVKNY